MDKKNLENREMKLIIQELKENPYRKFNLAFYLMSLIPFLVFIYLLAAKFFTITILVGHTGVLLFISALIALSGFYVGYRIIKSILNKMVNYAIQAKRSDQLKSTFVASVSHELKNPLFTIKMNLLNIKDGLAGQITEEQNKIIEVCYSILERVGRLINDLLDVHKIEAGMLEIRRKLCNIIDILDKQIREFEAVISKKRIKLNKEVSHKELSFWADEDKISQVVNNLLSNAVKYVPEGGAVTLKADYDDNFVRLECMDNGPGIPEDKLDKLFNKFERINITKEGTGLGLAISKDIIELHKGKIWAENIPQGGSKFIVVLPRDLRKNPR